MANGEILFKDVRIVDENKDFSGDLYIKNGRIADFGKELEYSCPVKRFDYEAVLMPSFIDLHSHFRDPGYTWKEDIVSGSKAAVKGGYTTVNLMANTSPVCSSEEIVDAVIQKAESAGLINCYQTVSVTRDFDGRDLSHLDTLNPERVRFLSDDGNGVEDTEVMEKAMIKAKAKGLIISSHAEYREISNKDPRASENLMTERDIALCRKTGCRLHMAHVSTKEALIMIQKAKAAKIPVTCEVTPHHLILSDSVDYAVHPPLRTQADISALRAGLADGTIDAIATDHAPHAKEDKEKGARGMSGIEIAFQICYTDLVKGGIISLSRLSGLMSKNPGEILGIESGTIEKNQNADIVIIDLDKQMTIDSNNFYSKGKNTPFDGKTVYGTIKEVYRNGKLMTTGDDENDN